MATTGVNTKPKKTRAKKKKKPRERIFKDGKWFTKTGRELTRCCNTLTEAEYFSFILSHCRRLTQKWKPINEKLQEAKRPYSGADKRVKFEYQCESCLMWYRKASKKVKEGIYIDHIVTCGGINNFDKIAGWFERALCEKEGLQRLCWQCHSAKTLEDKKR